MDSVLNPALAPFSADRASKTTVGAVALTYGIAGLILGMILSNKTS